MTHTLHREGSLESLRGDFVLVIMRGAGRADRRSASTWRLPITRGDDVRLHEASLRGRRWLNAQWRLALRHPRWSALVPGAERWITAPAAPVLRRLLPTTQAISDEEELRAFLVYLRRARLDVSVVVSGIADDVCRCAAGIGLSPHTVQLSLGAFGKMELVAPPPLLALSTMCGHHMVPPELVVRLLHAVSRGRITAGEAARQMARPCVCNAVNVERATRIIAQLADPKQVRALQTSLRSRPVACVETSVARDGSAAQGVQIDPARCTGCGRCGDLCPVGAIQRVGKRHRIDKALCVECDACLRFHVCPEDAFRLTPLSWPRELRRQLSSPNGVLPTGVSGRGTEEMKTNDATGRFGHGEVGLTVDVGRPGVGTSLRDVAAVCAQLAGVGVAFEEENPVTQLMTDRASGRLPSAILDERVLSCIVELKIPAARLGAVLASLRVAATQISTVFSIGCIGRVAADGQLPVAAQLRQLGVEYRPNGKVNLGLRA